LHQKRISENEFKEIPKFPKLKSLYAGNLGTHGNRESVPRLRYTVVYEKLSLKSELKSLYENGYLD
jgi:hypothetical protein